MPDLIWTYKQFDQLDLMELYRILQLRSTVFVVEQNCPYLDLDNKDQESYHMAGWKGNELVAYARLLPPGLSFSEASIGRVVSNPTYRNTGAGKQLMQKAIEITYTLFQVPEIRIGAQLYLQEFYTNLGFQKASEEYLEDNIPHIEMIHIK